MLVGYSLLYLMSPKSSLCFNGPECLCQFVSQFIGGVLRNGLVNVGVC